MLDCVIRGGTVVDGTGVPGFEADIGIRGGRVALNAGFLVGHSTIRRLVMGEDWKREASDAEVDAMAAHVAVSLRAGALGFSSSWGEAHVIVGASDAGAHVDSIATFGYFIDLVEPSVRERGLLSLQSAVHKLTGQAAEFFGLKGRDRVAEGYCADLVIFDPKTIAPEKVRVCNDMPGGQPRLFAGSPGIDHVLVKGVEVVRRGVATGAPPGTVLHSGRDTGDRSSPCADDRPSKRVGRRLNLHSER